MADLNALVDQLSELTVLEAAELSKMLEEKWGVSAAAAVAAAPPAAGAAATAAAAETPHFSSSIFESSAASRTVSSLSWSTSAFRSAMILPSYAGADAPKCQLKIACQKAPEIQAASFSA